MSRRVHAVASPPLWRLGALLAAVLVLGVRMPAHAATRVDALERWTVRMTVLDVGQGDAIAIQTADGKNVLVDTGRPSSQPALEAGLRALGIDRLDALVLTHAHADHIGNAAFLIETLPIRVILDSGYPHTSQLYAHLLDVIEHHKVRYRLLRRGATVKVGRFLRLEVLAPSEPLFSGTRSDVNSNSVVLRAVVGSFAALLEADAEEPTEQRLVHGASKLPLRADVLKVAHHGSAYATTPALLARVHPAVAIISCGLHNRYGHPAPETVARLRRAGVEVLVTAHDGDVAVTTDGARYAVRSHALGHGRGAGRPATRGAGGAAAPGTLPPRPAPAATPQGGASPPRPAPRAPPAAQAASAHPPRSAGGLDLNTATFDDLIALPRIGPVKARAILAYRKAHGGFRSVDELVEVRGIGPKTLARLRPLVRVGAAAPSPSARPPARPLTPAPSPQRAAAAEAEGAGAGALDLNTATFDDLVALPRIGPVKARAILAYRKAHGGFRSVDELVEVRGIGPKLLARLRPLVRVGSAPATGARSPAAPPPAPGADDEDP